MKKTFLIKLFAIVMMLSMVLSMFACDNELQKETESETKSNATESETVTEVTESDEKSPDDSETQTEADTAEKTETQTETKSEAETETATETESQTETETETETATETETEPETVTETETATEPETKTETETQTETEGETKACVHEWGEEVAAEGKHTFECVLCGKTKENNKHTFTVLEHGVSHVCVCGATRNCQAVKGSDKDGHWRRKCNICGIEAEEKSAHTGPLFEYTNENGVISYKYICSHCGYVINDYTPSDSINYYLSAGKFSTNAWASSTDGAVLIEDNVVYQRFSVTKHGSTIPLVHSGNVTDEYTVDIEGGSGKYFVFKIRTTNAIALSWRITSKADGGTAEKPSGAYQGMREDMPEGKWVTYVVDIQGLIDASGITTYGDALDPTKTKFAAAFMYGKDGLGDAENTYIDISYFAVCDSWEEVSEVAGDEIVTYTNWKESASDMKLSSDGALPVITKGEDASGVLYKKTGEKIQIYIRSPYTESYTRYDFLHLVNEKINYDCWKLLSIEICDSDLKKLYNTATDDQTECEGALQEIYANGSTAPDFIGGFHGDEYMTKITVMVDGIELDMSKNYELAACNKVEITVESYINRCESDEKVFERVRVNTWTEEGLEIRNKYIATADIKIQRPATAMLAIAIDNDGYEDLITEHWDNIHNEWIEIGEFSKSEGRYSAAGMTETRMRGLLEVYVSIYDNKINGVDNTPVGHFSYNYFGETNRRIKIYLDAFRGVSLKAGDVFECATFQSVFARGQE